jgi:predicted MPP superfamily phosphohydrolase
MSPLLGYLLLLASLAHLFLQGYNRHYLLIADGPAKRPLIIGWLVASFLLPALLVGLLAGLPPVRAALAFEPEGIVSKALFAGIGALHVFAAWRGALWFLDRATRRPSPHIREEAVARPRLEHPRRPHPLLRGIDTTTALEVVRREIEVPRLPPPFAGLTIAQVSDLHVHPPDGLMPFLEEVVDLVNRMAPDIVVLTGDYLNHPRHLRAAAELHGRLKAPLGVYAVLGNHDHWTSPKRIASALQKQGIVMLAGQRRVFARGGRRLVLAGTDAPWDRRNPDWRTLLQSHSADCVILVSHSPDIAPDAARHGANLVLSGHNHGGQVRLPLVGPLVVPSRLGHRFCDGFHEVSPSCVINVSRGIGCGTFPMRVLCPPEVVLLRLYPPALDAAVGAALRRVPLAMAVPR